MAGQLNRRRTALAEIPVRMSQLRVSTDEMPVLLNRTVIDSPLDNIPIGYLTPSPSQDELIIRQRGRRRSINWSPEKTPPAELLSILRTPTKSTSTMTLRSSPRKRLQLSDAIVSSSSVMLSPQSISQSPRKMSRAISQLATPQTYSPQVKRLRMTESPIAQINLQTPLNKILKGLSHTQLITLIQGLVDNEPNIEQKIRKNLPMPDIRPMGEQLTQLKKNIFKSLPTSRLVKSTDSVAYSRAATHLNTFKKLVIDQCHQLNDSENWDALIDYCLMAWPIVRSTPIWDNKTHNTIRRNCFKMLSWHCLSSLKAAGVALGEQRLKDFHNQIATMKIDCDDIATCSSHLDNLIEKFCNASATN